MKYTLVQHSGYGYAGKEGFKQGLEIRSVHTKKDESIVRKAGGVLFDSYRLIDQLSDRLTESTSLYPNYRGTFSDVKLDDLRIAIITPEMIMAVEPPHA